MPEPTQFSKELLDARINLLKDASRGPGFWERMASQTLAAEAGLVTTLTTALENCADSLEYINKAHPTTSGWLTREIYIERARTLCEHFRSAYAVRPLTVDEAVKVLVSQWARDRRNSRPGPLTDALDTLYKAFQRGPK